MQLVLPSNLSLDHMKSEARYLPHGVLTRESSALRRFYSLDPLAGASRPNLADAQYSIAREHGFSSWRKMEAQIILLLVLCLSFYPCVLRAQSTSASLTGRVTDPSKAAIAEARITAINSGTNFQYDAASNSSGEYFLANLAPGSYRIEVEKSGFKKLVRPEVTLHVQDALGLDFELPVGAAAETVVVQAGVPLVNTTSATVSTVIESQQIETTPLNGRNVMNLTALTPGVVPQGDFDGTVYEYFRNTVLDANSFFNIRTGVPRPPLQQNQ